MRPSARIFRSRHTWAADAKTNRAKIGCSKVEVIARNILYSRHHVMFCRYDIYPFLKHNGSFHFYVEFFFDTDKYFIGSDQMSKTTGVLIRKMNCLTFTSTWDHLRFFSVIHDTYLYGFLCSVELLGLSSLCVLCPMLLVSLDCQCTIAPSILYKIHF